MIRLRKRLTKDENRKRTTLFLALRAYEDGCQSIQEYIQNMTWSKEWLSNVVFK